MPETKPKPMSRRKAIALLTSGTALGAMVERPADAQGISCVNPAATRAIANRPAVLRVDSCCEETKAVILKGLPSLTPRGRNHLAPVKRQLNALTLEEYVFMVWGVTDEQRKELNELVDAKLHAWRG